MKDLIKNINGIEKVSVGSCYFSPSEYAQNLLDQLKDDIYPLFQGTPFFTVARNTFCFIDHVSALKYGPTSQTPRIKKLLGEFADFDLYINEKYQRYAAFIVQVYRHDLVHNIRPFPHKIKVIDKNGKLSTQISWFALSQAVRDNFPPRATFKQMAMYFKNTKNRSGLCHLRYHQNQIVINNFCLFFDLVNYLKNYKYILKNNENERVKFINNYQNIVKNHETISDFVLDKTIDKECVVV